MNILYIGDSHIFHLFPNEDNVIYLVDITLNKIRKGNGDTKIKYESYDKNINAIKYIISEDGSSLLDFINNFECDYVFLSIGEIDVRYHLSKQISKNINAINQIYDIYSNFLKKIKHKMILSSLTPPNDNIGNRVLITKEANEIIHKICNDSGYIYYDVYTDFNRDGLLSSEKSDGGTHINKSFFSYFIEKIKKIII